LSYIGEHFSNLELLSLHGNINLCDSDVLNLRQLDNLNTLDVFGCVNIKNKSFEYMKGLFPKLICNKVHF